MSTASILIMYDTGPITVGYQFTVYSTSESAGVVEICAIIYEPPTGGAPREFVVSSATRDGSASERLNGGNVVNVITLCVIISCRWRLPASVGQLDVCTWLYKRVPLCYHTQR